MRRLGKLDRSGPAKTLAGRKAIGVNAIPFRISRRVRLLTVRCNDIPRVLE
jgi:hypothetical protein